VAVKIRLKRFGKIRAPYYRVVVADSRTKRDGRVIEEIGKYHPTEEPSLIEIASERAQYWLGVGAQPSEQVLVLLKITGDWQKFKGLPGAEGTLRVAEGKKDDAKAAIEAAANAAEKLKAKAAEAAAAAKAAKAAEAAEAAKAAEAAATAEAETAAEAARATEAEAETALEQVPSEDVAEEAPVVEVAAEEAPVAEVAAEEAPVAEVAAEEAPVEDEKA